MSLTDDGNAESYMDAPPLAGLKGGGPSVIASILDLLGIHRQVAREPNTKSKNGDGEKPQPKDESGKKAPARNFLNQVEDVLTESRLQIPLGNDTSRDSNGQRYRTGRPSERAGGQNISAF